MNFVVGMTGGIGSGKSTAADLFAALGAAVVDTDVIAHELTAAGGAAMPAIAAAFGEGLRLADGALDRAAMRRLVFSDASAKNRLERILHPLITAESRARCRAAVHAPYVVLVVPLLVETGVFGEQLDRILVVDCDETMQVSRAMARSALSAADVRAIMATQATRCERLAAAADVLPNGDDRESLSARIKVLHEDYRELATRKLNADKLNVDC